MNMEPAIPDARKLAAVRARDKSSDGAFVYAVTTTGIYCRPSCASRQALSRNLRFFAFPAAAEAAGFRSCRRCRPELSAIVSPGLRRVQQACAAIESELAAGHAAAPALGRIAARIGIGARAMHRLFLRHLGVAPKAFVEARRVARLKKELRSGMGVAGAIYGASYGSPSSVYERADAELGMTPSSYAKGGAGVNVDVSIAPCALGKVLLATTERGIAAVKLGPTVAALMAELRQEFPAATIRHDPRRPDRWLQAVAAAVDGAPPDPRLPLDLRASAFSRRVWRELRRIPQGEVRTYSQIAASIGQPKAARAVGRACATNPIAVIVPCHRVVREDGGLGGYRWGIERKKRLLERERRAVSRPK
jgi:AraC family transcriptional regulator, regulatory protein of adaptative response / methylated-DNA-[protein]-cysteine methyltransferase